MKKTRMFFGNQYIGSFNCDGKRYTKWQRIVLKTRKIARRTILAGVALCSLGWIVYGSISYGLSHSETIFVKAEVIKEVPVEIIPAVMSRIAKCESGNTHYKNGQVIVNVNKNGTYDQGKYQINSIWNKKATELGYNLSEEKDNEMFAMYLYKTHGTEPWYSSKNCWNK
jgi:hypothetical protein